MLSCWRWKCRLLLFLSLFLLHATLVQATDDASTDFYPILSQRGAPEEILRRRELKQKTTAEILSRQTSRQITDANGNPHPALDTPYYFDQLIDHKNPSLGTFKMQYFHSWEFYKPGGPIVVALGGEDDLTPADGISHLSNYTISGALAQQEHGAIVSLEHRFFGQSRPYPDLSEESLKYLTIQQSIDDLEYFAKNAVLPMPGGNNVSASKAHWILVGGSYSGALTAWTMVNKPGVFWAGYASSAVVQPQVDFWQYYLPAQRWLPPACVADIQRVIGWVDDEFRSGDRVRIENMKTFFGLSGLPDEDFASELRYPIADWQSLHLGWSRSGKVLDFCTSLGVKDGNPAPADGWGLENARENWARIIVPTPGVQKCGPNGNSCPKIGNARAYDTSGRVYMDARDDNRAWAWLYCNEMGWFHTGMPLDQSLNQPHIISSALRVQYEQQRCAYAFPKTFTLSSLPRVDETLTAYGGWDLKVDRLFFVNGRRDPWVEVTMSASHLAGRSTNSMPIVLTEGYHCDDMAYYAAADPSLTTTRKLALDTFSVWLKETSNNDTGATQTQGRNAGTSSRASAWTLAVPLLCSCIVLFGFF